MRQTKMLDFDTSHFICTHKYIISFIALAITMIATVFLIYNRLIASERWSEDEIENSKFLTFFQSINSQILICILYFVSFILISLIQFSCSQRDRSLSYINDFERRNSQRNSQQRNNPNISSLIERSKSNNTNDSHTRSGSKNLSVNNRQSSSSSSLHSSDFLTNSRESQRNRYLAALPAYNYD